MSHQIFTWFHLELLQFLMYLIKKNSASKTVSVFFNTSYISFMAWIFLNENLNIIDIFGFFIATFGVYIATREKN